NRVDPVVREAGQTVGTGVCGDADLVRCVIAAGIERGRVVAARGVSCGSDEEHVAGAGLVDLIRQGPRVPTSSPGVAEHAWVHAGQRFTVPSFVQMFAARSGWV